MRGAAWYRLTYCSLVESEVALGADHFVWPHDFASARKGRNCALDKVSYIRRITELKELSRPIMNRWRSSQDVQNMFIHPVFLVCVRQQLR
jgi:hypothetical protein